MIRTKEERELNAERLRKLYVTQKPRKTLVNICTARRNWDGCDFCDVYAGCGLECWEQTKRHDCCKCEQRKREV